MLRPIRSLGVLMSTAGCSSIRTPAPVCPPFLDMLVESAALLEDMSLVKRPPSSPQRRLNR